MPRRENLKKRKAIELYKQNSNMSETARLVGVNRATVSRWLAEPGVLEGGCEPIQGFPALIPKALKVLDDALDGVNIKPAQIRAALEVVKASNALKETKAEGLETLADVIARLDAEDRDESD